MNEPIAFTIFLLFVFIYFDQQGGDGGSLLAV